MMLRKNQYLKPSEVIERAKQLLGVTKPNVQMADDDIKAVMRSVASSMPGTIPIDEELVTSREGIEMMLFLTLMVFPGYYERCGLSQFN